MRFIFGNKTTYPSLTFFLLFVKILLKNFFCQRNVIYLHYQSNIRTMTTLYFTARQRSMRVNPSSERGGLLEYHKGEKQFSCDSSDLDCAGMTRIPKEFEVKVVESGNTKVFKHVLDKYSSDEDVELMYHLFKSADGFSFIIFND